VPDLLNGGASYTDPSSMIDEYPPPGDTIMANQGTSPPQGPASRPGGGGRCSSKKRPLKKEEIDKMIRRLMGLARKPIDEKQKVYEEVVNDLKETGHYEETTERPPVLENGEAYAKTIPDYPGKNDLNKMWVPGATKNQKIYIYKKGIRRMLLEAGLGRVAWNEEQKAAELDLNIGVLIHELVHMNQSGKSEEGDEIEAYTKEKKYYNSAKMGCYYRKKSKGRPAYPAYRQLIDDRIKETQGQIKHNRDNLRRKRKRKRSKKD